MAEREKMTFNRRQLGRSAMLGSASIFFGTAVQAAPNAGETRGVLNARELGASGDGVTNDTAALQRAMDLAGKTGGAVFLPPGVYLTEELHVRPGTAVVGIPAWNYSGPGGSVLSLANACSSCLLNLTDARGSSVEGVALDGRNLGKGVHGIFVDRKSYPEHEDGFRIEGCQVAHFSGDGAHLDCVWCFSVRHCMLGHNGGDGLSLRGWDGFLLDNWFSGNHGAGFAARHENASVTFTANRIEWNHEENMLITGGDGYQITGNFFDRAGTCGIALRKGKQPCRQITITGNFVKRSGKFANADSHDSAQILLDAAEGVSCVGNSLEAGRDDGDAGIYSPSYGIVYQGLKNCVVTNNTLHEGALRQLVLDLGSSGDGVLAKDNPGQLFVGKR